MTFLGVWIETLQQSLVLLTFIGVSALLTFSFARVIYNIYFHPLSEIAGPKLWAASRFPFLYALLNATLVKRTRKFHEQYGDIIRIAPDEVSFAKEEAWGDIYARRKGHQRTPRDDTVFFGRTPRALERCLLLKAKCQTAPSQKTDNIVTTSDANFHSRARNLLSNSFTEDALRAQRPLIQGHCDIMFQNFKKLQVILSQRFLPYWFHFTRSVKRLDSICSLDSIHKKER